MNCPLPVVAAALTLPFATHAAEFDAAAAINHVGVDLFHQLAAERPDENLVISPYSIESALALACAGANGATRDELAKALHLPKEEAVVRSGLAALRTALAKVAEDSAKLAVRRDRDEPTAYAVMNGKRVELAGDAPEGIVWHEANRLFVQNGYALRVTFLNLMRDGYAAPLETVDFRDRAEPARLSINRWVEGQTVGKISDLISHGGVTNATRLVLVNALYLNAPWDTPFERSLTTPESFYLPGGNNSEVAMMRRDGHLAYEHQGDLAVVALDYLGGGLQCLFILPDKGVPLDDAVAGIKAGDFARWAQLGETRKTKVILHLPKFKIKGTTLPLSATLRHLGVKRAFDEPPGSADFDRIAPRRVGDYLKLSEVFHQTFINLDEKGTEAAAATAVLAMAGSRADPSKPIEVRVDHPFLFAIQHRASGACLFLGRITEPR